MKTSSKRSVKQRRYKAVFHIVTEGKITEPSYFKLIANYIPERAHYAISCLPADTASIPSILEKAKSVYSKQLYEQDELWVVLDQDKESHLRHQFEKLVTWIKKSPRGHLAISAPRFEYWLLCHFEDAPKKENSKHDSYVAKYLPGYDREKNLSRHGTKITTQAIQHAIEIASRTPLEGVDSERPGSNVWMLVEKLVPSQRTGA